MAAKKNYSRLFKAQKAFDEKIKREFLEGKSAVSILKNRKHFKILFKDNSDEAFFRYISKLTKEVNNPMKKITAGKYFEKWNEKQKEAFIKFVNHDINKFGSTDKNQHIKFINKAFNKFGNKIKEYNKSGMITLDNGDIYTYSWTEDRFLKIHIPIKNDEVKNPSENKVDEFNEIIHSFKKNFAGVIGISWGKYLNDEDLNYFKKHLKDEIDTLVMNEPYIFPENPAIRVKVIRAAILIEHHIEDLAAEGKISAEDKFLDNLLLAESKIIMYLRKYVK